MAAARRPPCSTTGGPGPSVVGLLAAQGLATPDAVAVDDGAERWSYAQLHRAAASVTGALARLGVGVGNAVGVCLPRSKEAIAAMMGVWAAGAIYVPLDPEYPTSRLAEMSDRARLSVLIGRPDHPSFSSPATVRVDAAGISPGVIDEDP
ncbi:MAG TPA: AMP-binding protein, partial [Acidimicrobiales bacterium]|nr:AMP-binding protein [Acidimicrobiales bacterium]